MSTPQKTHIFAHAAWHSVWPILTDGSWDCFDHVFFVRLAGRWCLMLYGSVSQQLLNFQPCIIFVALLNLCNSIFIWLQAFIIILFVKKEFFSFCYVVVFFYNFIQNEKNVRGLFFKQLSWIDSNWIKMNDFNVHRKHLTAATKIITFFPWISNSCSIILVRA